MDVNVIKGLIEKKVNELGYDLYSITTSKLKGDLILSIVVDKVDPIDMDMICEVSNTLSSYLDTIDSITEPYMLDVSSLGAEKPIKIEKIKEYVNRYVCLHLDHPFKGENILEGTITSCDDENLILTYRIKTRVVNAQIALNNITKARLAVKF